LDAVREVRRLELPRERRDRQLQSSSMVMRAVGAYCIDQAVIPLEFKMQW
jgi:hypothetical protein